MNNLPNELLYEIYRFIPYPYLLKYRRINKTFYDIIGLFFEDRKIPTNIDSIVTKYLLDGDIELIPTLLQHDNNQIKKNIIRLIIANGEDKYLRYLFCSTWEPQILQMVLESAAIYGRIDLIKYYRPVCGKEIKWGKICVIAAQNNHFEIIKRIITYFSTDKKNKISIFGRENYGIIFDQIVEHGNGEMMRWFIDNGYEWDDICSYMSKNGLSDNYSMLFSEAKRRGYPIDDALEIIIYYEKLNLLKWWKDHNYPIFNVTTYAARHGKLRLLKWLVMNGYPINENTCFNAAMSDNIKILQWLRKMGCEWDSRVCTEAARNGRLEILIWARQNGCPWNKYVCILAAQNKHFHVLNWARENGCECDPNTYDVAISKGYHDQTSYWQHFKYFFWYRYQKIKEDMIFQKFASKPSTCAWKYN